MAEDNLSTQTLPLGHSGLVGGRWEQLTLVEQLGNIGSEVGRAIRAESAGNNERSQAAFYRALELFDATAVCTRSAARREVLRAREVVCDYLVGDNDYNSDASSLEAYFIPFAMAARSGR